MTHDSLEQRPERDIRDELLHPRAFPADSARIVLAGAVCWVVALIVLLVVPSLHSGHRSWWPWVAVVGATLGVLGWAYISRGRGNAAAA